MGDGGRNGIFPHIKCVVHDFGTELYSAIQFMHHYIINMSGKWNAGRHVGIKIFIKVLFDMKNICYTTLSINSVV